MGQRLASNFKAPDVFKTGSLSGGEGLVVCGSINGKECQITVDTGSNISIVRPDLLQGNADSIQPVNSYLRTVTGETAPLCGQGELQVGIGSFEVLHKMWVADITEECILGLDFLTEHACKVNLQDNVMTLGEEEIPLEKPESKEAKCYRIVAKNMVKLLPNAETLIPGEAVGYSEHGSSRWGLLVPCPDSGMQNYGIVVGKVVVEMGKETIPVRVLNLSKKQMKIRRGTELATCEPVSSVRRELVTEPKGTSPHDVPL